MGLKDELVEERLKSFITQLYSEYGILDRMVYKNKNQHRRCSYFQYLLKVRRDLRLLQSARLEQILGYCFTVINEDKPAQKVHLLEGLKRKKIDMGKYNFMERLLGTAKLLSEMVEPMLKAAVEISTLLAQSFFMGFSVTILALLARIRVLVQQILLDVVSVFNLVSSISQEEQSVRLTQEGIEIFREYYPKNENVVTLECEWKTDKFALVQRIGKCKTETGNRDLGGDDPLKESSIQYQSISAFLGDDEPEDNESVSIQNMSVYNDMKRVQECSRAEDASRVTASSPDRTDPPESGLLIGCSTSSFNPLKRKTGSRNEVAFISVKRPEMSVGKLGEFKPEGNEAERTDREDKGGPFFNLLSGGNPKCSLF